MIESLFTKLSRVMEPLLIKILKQISVYAFKLLEEENKNFTVFSHKSDSNLFFFFLKTFWSLAAEETEERMCVSVSMFLLLWSVAVGHHCPQFGYACYKDNTHTHTQ